MTTILGATKYLFLADEATWGVEPASPDYVPLPVTEYNVRFRPQNRQSNPYTGLYQRKHSKNFRGMPSGQLNTPLYGWKLTPPGVSLAEYLLTWAFGNHESTELPSKLAEWAEGPNVANKRHLGLRVNSATLQGNDDSGVIELSLDLMGQSEQGNNVMTTAQTLPTDRHKLVDMEFADTTFQLAGVTVQAKSFSMQVQHGLKAEYLNSFTPTLLVKSQRVVTLSMVLVKNSDTYDAFRRAATATEFTGQIAIKGLHNGTGGVGTNWTVGTLTLPRLALLDVDDQGGKEDISTQTLNMVVLKPDTASNDLSIAWTEAA
jgi:hypothetical protein